MSLSMYQASVPVFIRGFENLLVILDKAAAHAKTKGFDPEVLLQSRLAPDMFPLIRQIQIASDITKGGAARLAGIEAPKYDDTEKSFADIKARIKKTVKFIKSTKAKQIDGSEANDIVIKTPKMELKFKGQAYLLDFVLPNFFFHLSMTYAILRHNGVDVGKMDFLGKIA